MSNTAQGLSSDNGGQADHSNTYTADTSRTNPDNPNAIGNSQGTYSLGLPADNPHIDPITGLMTGIGNIFSGIFGGLQNPTSIDATGADTKPAGVAPAKDTYRLSTTDLSPPTFTGTQFSSQPGDVMPGVGAQPSITGTPLGTPMQEPSQTLNGLLTANYEPVTGYSNNFSRLSTPNFTPAPNSDVSQAVTAPISNTSQPSIGQAILNLLTPDIQPNSPRNLTGPYRLSPADLVAAPADSKISDRIVSAEDVQNNSAATRQQAEQAAAQEAANLAARQAADAQIAAQQQASQNDNHGHDNSPNSGFGGNNNGVSTGGESASARSNGAWRMGGPVPKYGNGPPQPVRGTVHEGEYVIRPESVKMLPPGLLSALNDIYKSPNPKKTLRGLLG
jgi:hypothetical protein